MSIDPQLTALTRARYNRLAPIYDWLEAFAEAFSFRRWRKRLWEQVKGQKILEVGVGTGKNMPYYPSQAQVTAMARPTTSAPPAAKLPSTRIPTST